MPLQSKFAFLSAIITILLFLRLAKKAFKFCNKEFSMPAENLIGFITTKGKEEAKKIADALLQKKLIACANIIDNIESSYWWKGKIENSAEALLMIKTVRGKEQEIIKTVEQLHSYETPVIEFVIVHSANAASVEWIKKELK